MTNYRKQKLIFLFFVSVVLILTVCVLIIRDNNKKNIEQQCFSADIISADELESMISGKKKNGSEQFAEIQFNGQILPYDKDKKIWYAPQNIQKDEWEGKLSVKREDIFLSLIENENYKDKQYAIKNNIEFDFIAYNSKEYALGKIVFTGLPSISINDTKIEDGNIIGTCNVFNPYEENEINFSAGFNVSYHIRGGSSRNFPKKNYKMTLLKTNSDKKSSSLIGMRQDSDWVLNSLYSDPNRIREKLSADLWNEASTITDSIGYQMEYVELFINNSYQGIYGLEEPIDYKQTKLNKNKDVIYKIKSYDIPTSETVYYNSTAQDICCFQVKNGNRIISQELWEPCEAYLNLFVESSDAVLDQALNNNIDINSQIVFGLFVDAIKGNDNSWKNQYIGATIKNREYYFTRYLWDMDLTWGNEFDENSHTHSKYMADEYGAAVNETLFERITGLGKYDKIIIEQWKLLREGPFNTNNIISLIDKYEQTLDSSGAMAREKEKWPNAGITEDTSEIKNFVEKRMISMDARYSENVYD